MGGTETRRRPGLCLTGSVRGPFEPVPPGAPHSGASLLCSTQCSCLRPDHPTNTMDARLRPKRRNVPSSPPAAKSSKFNSVNRYFKADIRLAKSISIEESKALPSMTSRPRSVSRPFASNARPRVFHYSFGRRNLFASNGSHSIFFSVFRGKRTLDPFAAFRRIRISFFRTFFSVLH